MTNYSFIPLLPTASQITKKKHPCDVKMKKTPNSDNEKENPNTHHPNIS